MLEVELFTAEEVAAMTGRSRSTVRGLANRHGFGTKKGNLKLFTQADVDFIRNIDQAGGRPPEAPETLEKRAAERAQQAAAVRAQEQAKRAAEREAARQQKAALALAAKEAARRQKQQERESQSEARKAHLRQQKAEQARRRRARRREQEGSTPVSEPESS